MILRGFYGIVDSGDVDHATTLVRAGACAIQLRMKRATASEILAAARALRAAITTVPFVVNDRLDIALAVGADAVHLGQTDLPLAEARAVAAGRLAIGVSTHDLGQVRAAIAGGADYLGYGPIFATTTKENPDAVQGLDALRAAAAVAGATSIVAIGGITRETAQAVYAAGASCVCAIAAVREDPGNLNEFSRVSS